MRARTHNIFLGDDILICQAIGWESMKLEETDKFSACFPLITRYNKVAF